MNKTLFLMIALILISSVYAVNIDIEFEPKICPAVCVSMWELTDNECTYDSCGSGCGPNNINTFETEELCKDTITTDNGFDFGFLNECAYTTENGFCLSWIMVIIISIVLFIILKNL